MAETTEIEIDLSNGETVRGAVGPGYRFVIATDEGRSNILEIPKWEEYYPIMLDKNFTLEYYRSGTVYTLKLTPYNIAVKKMVQVSSAIKSNAVSPSMLTVVPLKTSPFFLRAAVLDFTMRISSYRDDGRGIDANVPATLAASQKNDAGYYLKVQLPDSSLGKQYVVKMPDDGKTHSLMQGNAPAVALPYYADAPAGRIWTI